VESASMSLPVPSLWEVDREKEEER